VSGKGTELENALQVGAGASDQTIRLRGGSKGRGITQISGPGAGPDPR
jgi:hypothetical protein